MLSLAADTPNPDSMSRRKKKRAQRVMRGLLFRSGEGNICEA
jgi:hypothetical protein